MFEELKIVSRRYLIESLLDNLFRVTITDIILDYHDNLREDPRENDRDLYW